MRNLIPPTLAQVPKEGGSDLPAGKGTEPDG